MQIKKNKHSTRKMYIYLPTYIHGYATHTYSLRKILSCVNFLGNIPLGKTPLEFSWANIPCRIHKPIKKSAIK